ncbi:hypothetical protein [Saccharopolyspora taberi]|uniref:Uncharacterized protein n=1 Tax=Saccharopolyspora taberi TaxID=60895 RepID=A0ABN3VCL5_9PSEU
MDFSDLGIPPGRDPEYPCRIWAEPHRCLHPYEHVRLQAAHFPADIEEAVFTMDCFACGSRFDQNSRQGWVYDYLARMMDEGRVGYVRKDDLEIVGRIDRERTKYGRIFDAITGHGNPITASPVVLRRPD